jgi:hypothetical protein
MFKGKQNKIAILAVATVMAGMMMVGTVNAADTGSAAARADTAPDLEDMLIYAIEDEYGALEHYAAIIDEYGAIRPFTNIMRSEETHIDLLEPLFVSYGFDLPEDVDHPAAPDSLKASFELGVEAEIANIAMYESFLDKDLPADVREVFERLMRGSENHLRAFETGLARYR